MLIKFHIKDISHKDAPFSERDNINSTAWSKYMIHSILTSLLELTWSQQQNSEM